MDKATFNQILEVNNEFYKCVAEEFSMSRQYAWPGWNKVLETYEGSELGEPDILDLGCGNGRFYDFLNKRNIACSYTGLDNNPKLLKLAADKFPEQTFKNTDVIRDLGRIKKKFNFITAFGVTHHIPGNEYRKAWFGEILNLCDKKCLVALTFWNFPQLKDKIIEGIEPSRLDENDYFLGWGTKSNILRYAHYYDQEELACITQIFEAADFKKTAEYDMDGRNSLLNHYLIYIRS